MKKIMMTIAAAFVATAMNAQTYVGGGVSFQTTSYDGESSTVFAIQPEIGYNLNEDWALGVAFGYGETGKDENKVKVYGVNPYARYTFAKLDKVNLFVDGGVGYNCTDTHAAKVNTFYVGLKPGVAVNLNDKLSFVAHAGFLGYQTSKPDYDGAKATNTFGLDLNSLNLTFGLYFNF